MQRSASPHRPRRPRAARAAALALGAALGLAGCDNPACIYGGDCSGGGGLSGGLGTNPASVPADGEFVRSGAPTVVALFPDSPSADTRSPVVIVFSESMAGNGIGFAFEIEAEGLGAVPFGNTALIGDGQVLVLFPLTPLLAGVQYTVRLRQGFAVQDRTGQALVVPLSRILGSFGVASTNPVNPSVLLSFPFDADTNQSQTGEIVVVFDRPMDTATVTDAAFVVLVNNAAPAFDPVAQPLSLNMGLSTDTRVFRWRSVDAMGQVAALPNNAGVEVRLSPPGNLIRDTGMNPLPETEFGYDLLPLGAPSAISITSFPADAIGIDQLTGPATLALEVTVPDGQDGDVLDLYLFGTRRQNDPNPPLGALLRTIPLEAPFTTMPLAAADVDLLSSDAPPTGRFADGDVSFAVALRRGSRTTPVRVLDLETTTAGVQSPVQDLVAPVITGFSTAGTNLTTLVSDQRDLVVVARADEEVRAALVTAGALGDNDFTGDQRPPVVGGRASGLFVAAPVRVPGAGTIALPTAFTLQAFDRALNASIVVGGTFRQVGASGPGNPLPAGSLSVQVYDATTRAPVTSATVFVHENVGGTVAFVAQAPVDPNGVAVVNGAMTPGGSTILTVSAPGFDLFTFDGLPRDVISVPLEPTNLGGAGVSGLVATTNPQLSLYTRSVADTRTSELAEPLFNVSACAFDNVQTRFECPWGVVGIASRRLGAQSSLAVLDPPSLILFAPLTYLKAFALDLPVAPVDPGATDATGELSVPFLLDQPEIDPEERPLEAPALALSTAAYPMISGRPRVVVEGLAPGIGSGVTVGQGVAFDLMPPSTNWGVRAAYPGAVDGIPDAPGDVLGRYVVSGTIEPDLLLRVEVVDTLGNRGGSRPRFSSAPVAVAPPAPDLLLSGNGAFDPGVASMVFSASDGLADAAGQPGFHRAVLTDAAGRDWTIWTLDPPDAAGGVTFHAPLIGPGNTLPLAAGLLDVQISAYSWAALDTGEFLWSDVEREHDRYSHAGLQSLTPP